MLFHIEAAATYFPAELHLFMTEELNDTNMGWRKFSAQIVKNREG
jgi:hypothetical protein